MRTIGLALFSLAFVSAYASAAPPPVIVPTDVDVRLTATPSANLQPAQPIDFALAVTNLGPMPAPNVVVASTVFVNQIHLIPDSNDCLLILGTMDGSAGPSFSYYWFPTLGAPALAVGETRTCHFQMALTASSPPSYAFGFGLPPEFVDLELSNDNATVVLRRTVAPIPALSTGFMLLLATLLAAAAWGSRGTAINLPKSARKRAYLC